jgi:hypothetical protein
MARGLTRTALTGAALFLAAAAGTLATQRGVFAADHIDPPTRTDPAVDPVPDEAGDLADVYAFFDATHVVLAVTFGGPAATHKPAFYDRDILYNLHVSNDGDPAQAEIPIKIRFGFDGPHAGVQITGLPNGITIAGPVESNLELGGITARAGLFDDPFFFDAQGLRESRTMGVLRFNNQRSFFANANITAVVIKIPRTMIQNGNRLVHVWSDTARFGGQL